MKHHLTKRIHEGKIAVVTGSSRGIGAAIARNLAAKGANIVITFHQTSSLSVAESLASELSSQYSVKVCCCQANIATESGIDSIITACSDIFEPEQRPQIDIVVNNAACFSALKMGEIKPEDLCRAYETNVMGPMLLVQKCLPYLPLDRSGRIVNISSVASKLGPTGTTLHAGTKAALESMTRTWARELAESCTVNAVSVGYTMTDMLSNAGNEARDGMKIYSPFTPLSSPQSCDSQEQKELAAKQGGRAAYPEEIAGVVAIICDPESSWMTGCLLGANGGLAMIG